jgi:hypothetical protein
MIIEGGEAMVKKGMVVIGRAQWVLFLLHLDDSIHMMIKV